MMINDVEQFIPRVAQRQPNSAVRETQTMFDNVNDIDAYDVLALLTVARIGRELLQTLPEDAARERFHVWDIDETLIRASRASYALAKDIVVVSTKR